MTRLSLAVAGLVLCSLPSVASGQAPRELADSDLVISHVSFRGDSSQVIAALGQPSSRSGERWTYDGVVVYFKNGRVEQMHLVDPRYATARGLRVGDKVSRLTALYGPTCVEGSFDFCRVVGGDFDARGIVVAVSNGKVTGVIVGAVFEL
jgi:hypothetical protein